jgi:ATP-dependent DNA helicase RecQ
MKHDGANGPNPLLALTPALLHAITGERRTRLITYLKRWNEHAVLLRYLDTWLAAQPELATLRQARAAALIALNQPAAGLVILDELDDERSVTESRQRLRFEALLSSRSWDKATQLLGTLGSAAYGDLLMAQGDLHGARRVFAQAALDRDALPGTKEIRATLFGGDPARAKALLEERRAGRRDVAPTLEELQLWQEIAAALGDSDAAAKAQAEIAGLEAAERDALLRLLGLGERSDLEVVPDVPALEEGSVEAPPEALTFLREHWGYSGLRGGQAATITRVLEGRSVLAVLPTGAGKSLTYQLPAMLLPGATVVISPLIALMKDQMDSLPPVVRDQATAINSTLSASEAAQRLREVRAGRYKLVFVAPERLRQQAFVHALREAGVARLVVDEAHCVSLWGLSFRPDYLFIRRVLDELGDPPVLALTATATPDTRAEIVEQLGDMDLVAASVFRPNLDFSVVRVANAEAKTVALVDLCREIRGPILVYARARERCEQLAKLLLRKGISAGYYHAQVEDRARAQEAFMSGAVRVLVATVAFGMGIDKPDIRAIIHYNLPQSVEAYYQEAGRAGRDGLSSRCVLLYTSSDKGQLTGWLRQEALHRDDLRAVYKVLRSHNVAGSALLSAEVLGRDLPELDETQLRVALGMLERAGLIHRHFDLASVLRVTLMRESEDPDLGHLVAAAGLRLGIPVQIDAVALACELGRRPDQIEADLLRWSAQGLLRVDGGARDLLLELLPAPADTPVRIEAMLREYAERQDARVEAMAAYATGLSCRHRALAAHFGERLPACGNACDVCRGDGATRRSGGRTPRVKPRPTMQPLDTQTATQSALRTLRNLPFSVGRTGLQRILTGSVESPIGPDRCAEWGRLQGWTKTATNRLIEELIDQGLVARNDRGAYPSLELTDAGHLALDNQ